MVGSALQNKDTAIPFNILRDVDLMVRAQEGTKKCMCLSTLSCAATQSAGLVELSLDDHTLEQTVDEDRYSYYFECLVSRLVINALQLTRAQKPGWPGWRSKAV